MYIMYKCIIYKCVIHTTKLEVRPSVIEIIPSAEILLRPSTIYDLSVVSETDMPRL